MSFMLGRFLNVCAPGRAENRRGECWELLEFFLIDSLSRTILLSRKFIHILAAHIPIPNIY